MAEKTTRVTYTHTDLKDFLADTFVLETRKENGQEVEVKLTKKQSDEIVKTIFGKVATETMSGKDVKMLGLGTAKRVARQARTGRNPLTKETIEIPAHYALKVDAEKSVKDALKDMPVAAEDLE